MPPPGSGMLSGMQAFRLFCILAVNPAQRVDRRPLECLGSLRATTPSPSVNMSERNADHV